MKHDTISKKDKIISRKAYNAHNFMNLFAITLTFSNVLNLFLIKLGATSSQFGMYTALIQASLIATLLGNKFMKPSKEVWVYGTFFFIRTSILAICLFIFASFAFDLKIFTQQFAISSILVIFTIFSIVRGIGLMTQNPLVNEIAKGKDKGDYLASIQINSQIAIVISGVLLTIVFKISDSYVSYFIMFCIGIITSYIAYFFFIGIRQPNMGDAKGQGLRKCFSDILKDKVKTKFFIIYFFSLFVVNMTAPFLILYAKKVYGINDSIVSILVFLPNLGAILIGIVAKNVIDKVGPNPVIFVSSLIFFLHIITIIFFPKLTIVLLIIAFTLSSLLQGMGRVGLDTSFQNYAFRFLTLKNQLSLSIITSLVQGFGGGLGSLLGGVVLDSFISNTDNIKTAYFNYFVLCGTLFFIVIIFTITLLDKIGIDKEISPFSIINPLNINSFVLFKNLDQKEHDIDYEANIIKKIGKSKNNILSIDLVSLLNSPFHVIKTEAIGALENMDIDTETVKELIKLLKTRPIGISHLIAKMLGDIKVGQSYCIETLKEIVLDKNEQDYLLKSRAILSLGKLKDIEILNYYQTILHQDYDNYITMIYLIRAIKMQQDKESALNALSNMLNYENIKQHENIEDEIILTISYIIGVEKQFYKRYIHYIEDAHFINDFKEEVSSLKKNSDKISLFDTFYDEALFNEELIKKYKNDYVINILIKNSDKESIRFLILIYIVYK